MTSRTSGGLYLARSPRSVRYLILVAVAVAAAGVLAVAIPKVLLWVRVVAAIAVVVTPLLVAEVRLRAGRADTLRQLIRESTAGAMDVLPMVSEVAPNRVGVHRAVTPIPYLVRDQEEVLGAALRRDQRLLIAGTSMAGKTRLMLKLAQDSFPDRHLLRPAAGNSIHSLLSKGVLPSSDLVVWLDDLEYFASSGGLSSGDLSTLAQSGVVVLATIRTKAYRSLRSSDDDKGPGSDVLAWFGRPIVVNSWSDTEYQRLEQAVDDPSLIRAAKEVGLSQYLGGAPLVLNELENGKLDEPLGYALVRAAADWRRTGIGRPIPVDLLQQAAASYVPGKVQLSPQSFEVAMLWATNLLNHTVALLQHQGSDNYEVLDLVFEYFDVDEIDALDSSSNQSRINDAVWALALEFATSDELNDIGYRGIFNHDRPDIALEAWSNSLHPSAQYYLTKLFGVPVDPTTLRASAASATSPEGLAHAAAILEDLGDSNLAEQRAREASHLGDMTALFNLACKKHNAKDLEAAERLYLAAHEAGMPIVGYNLGMLYIDQQKLADAEIWLRRSAEENNFPGGMTALAKLLELRGEFAEADRWYEAGARLGLPESMRDFGCALVRRNNLQDAERWLRTAADTGDGESMYALAALLQEDRPEESRTWLSRSAASGFTPVSEERDTSS